VERFAREKHCNLFRKSVNYSRKKFYWIVPWFFSHLRMTLNHYLAKEIFQFVILAKKKNRDKKQFYKGQRDQAG
jgi:hypothetical protein